jgi:prepilin-type N-terminal cleavage/methylation domain-containing protein
MTSDGKAVGTRTLFSRHSSLITRHFFAFTLVELLVVIAILGILAGLAVPALKNLGKADAGVSAARQLLDDVGRARQLALSQRTTVYMVFVPTNFWNTTFGSGPFKSRWFNALTPAAASAATNLCDKQLTGYTFIANGAVGDQPGRHLWHYLAPWSSLPDGTFIAQQKFNEPPNLSYPIADFISGAAYSIYGFNVTNTIPFPTETNTVPPSPAANDLPYLPYIAFNYLGQLTVDGVNASSRDEFIPLAHGIVSPMYDPATRKYVLNLPPPAPQIQVAEIPPGNSTNLSYNIVHVDALTGRAVLEFHNVLP